MIVNANANITPQINTQCIEPIRFLEQHFISHHQTIKDWFAEQWRLSTPPIYGSVDLRNAGFKVAPIDMNLFPAGFNNLNPSFLPLSVKAAKTAVEQFSPQAKNILVIPESHTRNLFYWSNIKVLQTILEQAGFTVRLGFLGAEVTAPTDIQFSEAGKVTVEPLRRENNELCLDGFTPDLVLLNNDLSDGIPAILQNLKQKPIPPAELGWSQRLKSEHFQYYKAVADEFSRKIGIDPWLIDPLFRHCGQIDFMQQSGLECLISNAEILFTEIEKKYAQYNITHQPFLIVKADAGTYGMAVMTVRNIDELKNMNRKQRTKMATIKGGQPVRRVIIQEGVYTFETVGEDQAVAEPVVYLWGNCVVGGFYRVHQARANDESLNAPGMRFEPIAFAQTCAEPKPDAEAGSCQNRLYVYGIVAQLSMLAAAREMKDQNKI